MILEINNNKSIDDLRCEKSTKGHVAAGQMKISTVGLLTLCLGFLFATAEASQACVDMCTGVYTSTCMAYGNENLLLPSGIMDGYAISAAGKEDGIDYYLRSTDPDYLGLEWREYGHYNLTTDSTTDPGPLQNCAGSLALQAWDGNEWIPFEFEMEWNSNDNAESFYLSTTIGFSCHYVRLSGEECKAAHRAVVDGILAKDMVPDIPGEEELCASSSNIDDDISAAPGLKFAIAVAPLLAMSLGAIARI